MREVIQTDRAPIMPVPISQAVAHGSTLYVGGQAGFDPATRKLVSSCFVKQFVQAMDNLRAIVEAAGTNLDQALKVTVYLRDLKDYDQLNEIYGSYFSKSPPARKVIQSQLLDGLLVEVDAIVALDNAGTEHTGMIGGAHDR